MSKHDGYKVEPYGTPHGIRYAVTRRLPNGFYVRVGTAYSLFQAEAQIAEDAQAQRAKAEGRAVIERAEGGGA